MWTRRSFARRGRSEARRGRSEARRGRIDARRGRSETRDRRSFVRRARRLTRASQRRLYRRGGQLRARRKVLRRRSPHSSTGSTGSRSHSRRPWRLPEQEATPQSTLPCPGRCSTPWPAFRSPPMAIAPSLRNSPPNRPTGAERSSRCPRSSAATRPGRCLRRSASSSPNPRSSVPTSCRCPPSSKPASMFPRPSPCCSPVHRRSPPATFPSSRSRTRQSKPLPLRQAPPSKNSAWPGT